MYKIGDKIKIISKNADKAGEDFLYYTVIDGIQIKEEGNRYTVGGTAINPDITKKCTKAEITKHYA